jgi:hypothetical protein
MALERAGDVAQVYAQADEPTKRAYNQAFFTNLLISPEWDDEQGRVRVSQALSYPSLTSLSWRTTSLPRSWPRSS